MIYILDCHICYNISTAPCKTFQIVKPHQTWLLLKKNQIDFFLSFSTPLVGNKSHHKKKWNKYNLYTRETQPMLKSGSCSKQHKKGNKYDAPMDNKNIIIHRTVISN